MIYLMGLALLLWSYCYQKSPVVWPTRAGPPDPAFTRMARTHRAIIELEERIYPYANRIALGLLAVWAAAWYFGPASYAMWSFTAIALCYAGAHTFPAIYYRHLQRI